MIKKEILQRLEYLYGVLNADDNELKDRFSKDFNNQDIKNDFLINTTKAMIKDMIIDIKKSIKGKEITPFTDEDLLMLDIPLLLDLDFDLGIPGGNDDE